MCSEVGLFHLEERDEALFSFLQFAPHKNDSFLHLIPDRLRVLIRDELLYVIVVLSGLGQVCTPKLLK